MIKFRTFEIAVQFYRLSVTLPLRGAIREQLNRAALSVPLNLAEGRGKPTVKDQLQFFHIAFGSIRECQAILTIADLQGSEAWKLLDSLAAHLYRLIKNSKAG